MMLARSPVATPSANASPRSSFHVFHYASAPSPRQSPNRVSAAAAAAAAGSALSRRHSQSHPHSHSALSSVVSPTTIASPNPNTRPKRYVGVDAATQYSPMEPMDYATGALLPRNPPPPSLTDPESVAPPAVQAPGVMAASDPGLVGPTPQPAQAKSHVVKPTASPRGRPTGEISNAQAVSPSSKRRNSQGPSGPSGSTSQSTTQDPPSLAKRSKPGTLAPKVLPQRYELCATEDVVELVAYMLGELIDTNDALALKSGRLTRFHSRTAPGITVREYLHRLAKHATLSPPLLLSMVYYIDRLCAMYPEFTINTLTVHRFLITAATVAAKGLSDLFWNNTTYARVGGIRVAELKLLELEFLRRVDWKIVPNPEVLVSYYRGLVERCPGYLLQVEGVTEAVDGQVGVANNENGDDDGEETDDSDEIDESDDMDEDEDEEGGEPVEAQLRCPSPNTNAPIGGSTATSCS